MVKKDKKYDIIFCSLYFSDNIKTGANKRFLESINPL